MHGSQTESVGCVLRGQLVLAITEPTKFKEIRLFFQGNSKVGWLDGEGIGQYYKGEEKILYQHDWIFLPGDKDYHVLKPDNYHWDFELILPGTLPETIEECKYGSIKYILKAVAERNTFALNLHTQRKVTIVRSLLPDSLEYMQTAVVTHNWRNKIQYEFSMNSKVFRLGDKIPIFLELKSIDENFKFQTISCMFKEYATYSIGAIQKTHAKVIKIVSADVNSFSRDMNSWNHFMEISIPNNLTYCLYDTQNDIIRIKHQLKFFMTFFNIVNNIHFELRTYLSIIITPASCYSNDMNLPAYGENCVNTTNIEDDQISTSPLSNFSSTCSLVESIHEIEEMSKLPSYRSIASLIPVPLADSSLPPTYDASVNPR
ncbi:hypothetical protein C1645_469656 [Glomus cerebriforme]|uniref:Arrestin C-terminal-like domain-containing protein n=1 Tax=Glomus cerebriforme TaxID=658196 RepID=A0A397SG72_9GLOM|nr:hypothetical protein C1645_469656 [Glomus cerebriforme]